MTVYDGDDNERLREDIILILKNHQAELESCFLDSHTEQFMRMFQ